MTQKEALDILKTNSNVYLTGSAGSGKTYVLTQFISHLKWLGVKVGITASTGIAATQINGMTLNSWAGIGTLQQLTDDDLENLLKRKYLHRRFRGTKVLIIDEISMLPASSLELVNRVCKAFKRSKLSFGGMQVVLCGDFFQLPPIGNGGEVPMLAYQSKVWEELDLKICYLDKPYRQTDTRFLSMLSEIRRNSITTQTWKIVKERFIAPLPNGMIPTKLFTHNYAADTINARELEKIPEREHIFNMRVKGNGTLVETMKKNCLAPERLVIKRGALVMFVKNNFEGGYVNGTMGKIIDFTKKERYPIVETFAGQKIIAAPAEWVIEEEGELKVKLIQIPLRLAWAITIHKSQGLSLDAAEIDLGKSFVKGMGYVALSRVRNLEGLRLKSINRIALSVNEDVISFDKYLQHESESVCLQLRNSYWYRQNNQKPSWYGVS